MPGLRPNQTRPGKKRNLRNPLRQLQRRRTVPRSFSHAVYEGNRHSEWQIALARQRHLWIINQLRHPDVSSDDSGQLLQAKDTPGRAQTASSPVNCFSCIWQMNFTKLWYLNDQALVLFLCNPSLHTQATGNTPLTTLPRVIPHSRSVL